MRRMDTQPRSNRLILRTVRNAVFATAVTNPNIGRYKRCSKITSLIRTMLDSILKVKKNQKIPNEINLCRGKLLTPAQRRPKRGRSEKKVCGSNKLFAIG